MLGWIEQRHLPLLEWNAQNSWKAYIHPEAPSTNYGQHLHNSGSTRQTALLPPLPMNAGSKGHDTHFGYPPDHLTGQEWMTARWHDKSQAVGLEALQGLPGELLGHFNIPIYLGTLSNPSREESWTGQKTRSHLLQTHKLAFRRNQTLDLSNSVLLLLGRQAVALQGQEHRSL